MSEFPLSKLYYSTEPDIPVVDGPLCQGYRLCLDGKWHDGRDVIVSFLASVFHSRKGEMSTRRFLPRGEEVNSVNIHRAAGARYDKLHLPLLMKIMRDGYMPEMGTPITIMDAGSKAYVQDGKNRSSILAAYGYNGVPNVKVSHKCLTKEKFDQLASNPSARDFWRAKNGRWQYYSVVLEWIREMGLSLFSSVLEIGPLGVPLVADSHTLDFENKHWSFNGYKTTFVHDVRRIPWPFEDKRYDLLVALRVWHWLAPVQKEALQEAFRVAKRIIIVCPDTDVPRAVPISKEQMVEWAGRKPLKTKDLGTWGQCYLFEGNV